MPLSNESKGDEYQTLIKVDVQMGLYPECSPEELVHRAEELLNAAFHKARQRDSNRVSQNTEDTEEFEQEVYSMIDRISKRDATFKGSEVKCVMLTFQCTSHASLKWLLEYFQSPDFQTHLERIAAALKKRLNIEGEVAITSNFTEENLQNILEIIGAQDEGSGSLSECRRNRVRDLKGEENTSERNWKKLEKVRQKEDAGRMASQLRLDEERYRNWVRGATGLKFVHEGLKDTVGTTSRNHRDQELQNILSTLSPPSSANQCSLCTSDNLLPEHAAHANRPCNKKTCLQSDPSKCFGSKPTNRRRCPNGICSKLYDGIVCAHRYKDPMWRNTDPTTWCTDIQGWSFGGKCYQTTPNFGQSADETDAAGLLSVILNNTYFQTDIACNLAVQKNSFAQARDKRNDILHSPKMELEDSQLQRYLDVFINVLQDKKKLFNDAKAKESVNKLVELKNNQITISMSEEISLIQMRKDALSALEQLQEKEIEAMKSLEEKKTEVLTAVDSAAASAIGTLESNDVHKRLTETEEAIKILTDTVQQIKMSDSVESRVVEEPAISESKYNIRVQNLQEDLIDSYRSDLREMSLTPLLEKRTPLLQFFQMPDLVRVTERREMGRAAKVDRTPIDTWDNLLHQSDPRSIYVCADAGLGKTAFSKYLALAWCQSKKLLQEETTCFKTEHLKAIGKFRFVFLLFLRESQNSKCDLKDMIWEQLVSKRLRSPEKEDLERILYEEKCLIILDGLDEWTHPSTCGRESTVPHWDKRENVTVITTTRPWKLNVAILESGQVNQRIELTGLNQESADDLKYSFLSYFRMQQLKVECLRQQDKDEVYSSVEEFTRKVSDKHATQLESVPLMLMYMLFLYMHGLNLGDTECDLYCRIIELLLSHAFEQKQESVTSTTEKIPPCFNELKHCVKFYNPYLKPLGELAFETLLEEKGEENTLVFDSSVAIKCLGEECFKQCLKTGIISQSKCVQTHPLIQESTVSFSHKTIQEFFAALYIYSEPDDTRMSQLVLSKCKNVQDILDMSKIIMFISGMNGNIAALISREMMNIINDDEITQEYRNTAEIGSNEHPLKDLQNMFVSCCKEMQFASGDNLYIQCVFIVVRDCKDEQYRVNLKQLIQHNKNNITSVYIYMLGMEYTPYNSVQKVVEYFELKDLKNIVKISCRYSKDSENIIPVLNTQVKCLELVEGSWSHSLCEKVTSLQKLEAIYIGGFTMSHSELRLLYDFISQKVDMRQIVLEDLNCYDHEESSFSYHGSSCSGLSLDLFRHSQLRELSLVRIPWLELNINMTSLARCELWDLSLSSLVFTHGTCDIVNSELNNSYVILSGVTIPASVLKDLVIVLQTLPYTVCVEIKRCDIKPKSEWYTLKQQIKKSPHFKVTEEDDGRPVFKFETIKHGY